MIRAPRGSTPGVPFPRIAIAATVVLSTCNPTGNPTGTSISHRVAESPDPTDARAVLVGIVTVPANVGPPIAAWKALGRVGTPVVAVLFGAIACLALQEGRVDPDSTGSIARPGSILIGTFFGIGPAGAIVWRRATGQLVTDEAPDVER